MRTTYSHTAATVCGRHRHSVNNALSASHQLILFTRPLHALYRSSSPLIAHFPFLRNLCSSIRCRSRISPAPLIDCKIQSAAVASSSALLRFDTVSDRLFACLTLCALQLASRSNLDLLTDHCKKSLFRMS